jgi:hypothetical protein
MSLLVDIPEIEKVFVWRAPLILEECQCIIAFSASAVPRELWEYQADRPGKDTINIRELCTGCLVKGWHPIKTLLPAVKKKPPVWPGR